MCFIIGNTLVLHSGYQDSVSESIDQFSQETHGETSFGEQWRLEYYFAIANTNVCAEEDSSAGIYMTDSFEMVGAEEPSCGMHLVIMSTYGVLHV